jgi:hypothetical protein
MSGSSGERWRDRSALAILTRHFFGRFFNNELLSAGGDMTLSVTQVLALLPVPGAILSLYYLFMKYAFEIARVGSWTAVDSWSDRCFFVALSMIVMGLATLLNWDNLFPDQKDYLNLTPLPVKLRTLFLAKVASLLLFMTLFSFMINAASGVLYPLAATVNHASATDGLRFLAAHFVSVLSASAFVFLMLVALQGVCMSVLSRRMFQRISVAIQSSLLVLMLSSFFVMSDLIVKVRSAHNPLYDRLFVPAWFTTLYDRLLGLDPLRGAAVSWWLPLEALAVVSALAAACYAVNYRRHLSRFLETSPGRDDRQTLVGALLALVRRAVTREPEETAAFDFVTATLARSSRHRMVLGSCLGVGLAFSLAGVFVLITREGGAGLRQVNSTLLSVPALLSFFLLTGLRFAFTLPSDLAANWIFRTIVFRHDVYWRGVRKAVVTVILAPIFLASLLSFAYLWGWSSAWRLSLLETLAAVILMEWLFRGFRKAPFTCPYLPGQANLKLRWPVYIIWFSGYLGLVEGLCAMLVSRPWHFAGAVALGVLLVWRLVAARRQFLRRWSPVFEERVGVELLTLGVSQMRQPAPSAPPVPAVARLSSR